MAAVEIPIMMMMTIIVVMMMAVAIFFWTSATARTGLLIIRILFSIWIATSVSSGDPRSFGSRFNVKQSFTFSIKMITHFYTFYYVFYFFDWFLEPGFFIQNTVCNKFPRICNAPQEIFYCSMMTPCYCEIASPRLTKSPIRIKIYCAQWDKSSVMVNGSKPIGRIKGTEKENTANLTQLQFKKW